MLADDTILYGTMSSKSDYIATGLKQRYELGKNLAD